MQLFMGAAQVIIDPAGINLTISRDQQGEDFTIEPMLDTAPLTSLASSQPVDYTQTGVSAKAVLTIADMDLKNQIYALCTNTNVVVDGAKTKVVMRDLAGTKPVARKIIIKPYNGLLPNSDPNTWITIPAAKITDLNGSNMTFGLKTQQNIKFTFMATPDSTGAKLILGDETANG